jgi:pantoate--beta-alanine ligase
MIALPRVIRSSLELRQWRNQTSGDVGFVPTMGALHEGHAELLKQLRKSCDHLVLSIFVNPTQFGPNEDLSKYPRTFEKDLQIAAREKVDIVYAPSVEEIYPDGFSTFVEETKLSQPLCGQFRPGHFRGVTTIVLKLLSLCQPQLAYFGLKDAQQFFVLDKMVKDLSLPTSLHGIATVRENDGLALSSRNVYLSSAERELAPLLYQELVQLKKIFLSATSLTEVISSLQHSRLKLTSLGFGVQYLELLKLPRFETVVSGDDLRRPCIIAAAAYLGKTRLIDNILIHPEKLSQYGIQVQVS